MLDILGGVEYGGGLCILPLTLQLLPVWMVENSSAESRTEETRHSRKEVGKACCGVGCVSVVQGTSAFLLAVYQHGSKLVSGVEGCGGFRLHRVGQDGGLQT